MRNLSLRRVGAWMAVLATLLLGGCAWLSPGRPPLLILVSIDGFKPEYLQRGITPTLNALAQEGVLAPQGMEPSFPVLTFPNHYTLVTGLTPGRHGLVGNTMTDPSIPGVTFRNSNRATASDRRWWDDATPLWVTAQRQGLRASTMFWPGTEAAIQGVRPNDWMPFSKEFKAPQRVGQVLSWLDRPVGERPDFVTLYFDTVDHEGHHNPPDGPKLNAAIAEVDQVLGQLVAGLKARGLWERTNLLVLSDHGMTPMDIERRLIVLDELMDLSKVEKFDNWGPALGFSPLPGHEAALAKALVGTPHEHVRCWAKADVPARFDFSQHRRIPAYVCLAERGWSMATRERVTRSKIPDVGNHGFDPQDPEMAALFIAAGPAFKPGTQLAKFRNVDVYPLMTHLLRIQPEANQGRLATFDAVLVR